MDKDGIASAAEPVIDPAKRRKELAAQKPRRQPRYHVILWDDDDHSYEYVMLMMIELFGHEFEKGLEIAKRVDRSGRSIVLTTSAQTRPAGMRRGGGTGSWAGGGSGSPAVPRSGSRHRRAVRAAAPGPVRKAVMSVP